MAKCRICDTKYQAFISFGQMPIANGFLTPDEYEDEYFFELQVGICPHCHMVQLIKQPERERMFHKDYAFFSSTSAFQKKHFKKFSEMLQKKYLLSPNPLVIELGSNDGIMLQNFAQQNIRHLGIEPSKNVAQVASDKGVNTISEFFDEQLASKIIDQHGQADTISAANVMCHIPYIHSVISGIKKLLKKNGVFIFEDPYLGDIVEKTSYDQIYDEHVFYFSLHSVQFLFAQHNMQLVDIEHLSVHGGSMRYTIAHKNAKIISNAVKHQLAHEVSLGLNQIKTYEKLRHNIEKSRDDLLNLLQKIKKTGRRIAAYGATSKSTTITNYCKIGPQLIEFISDTTPIKQHKYSPGTHIPVKTYEQFKSNYPDYALLFAWNHAKEIMANETDFIASGGQWIVYVPEVNTLS